MLTHTRPRGLSGRADAGFSLVELLVAISVLGILLGGITSALIVALETTRGTDARVSESRDIHAVAAYLPDDAAGANGFATSGAPRCGGDSDLVVEFRGTDFEPSLASATVVTSYVLRSTTAGGMATRELHRLACRSSAASPAYPLTPVRDTPLARLLSVQTLPTVACTDRARAPVSCGAANAVSVTLGLTSRSGEITASVTGHRRTT